MRGVGQGLLDFIEEDFKIKISLSSIINRKARLLKRWAR